MKTKTLTFRRHADKAGGDAAKKGVGLATGLMPRGLWRAFGKGIVTRGRTEFGSTGITRTNWSAMMAKLGHQLTFGRTAGTVKSKPHLDIMALVYDMHAVEEGIKKFGDDGFLRKWLDGGVSPKIMVNAQEIADTIIKAEVKAIMEGKASNIENYINSWTVEAIYERLTGARFDLTHTRKKPVSKDTPKGVRYTEKLRIKFSRKGRAILYYRGQRFDVTERLNQIMAGKAIQ
jgi:hypothetical protein